MRSNFHKQLLTIVFAVLIQTISNGQISIQFHNIPTNIQATDGSLEAEDYMEFTVSNIPNDTNYDFNFRYYNGKSFGIRYTQVYLSDTFKKNQRSGYKNTNRHTEIISTIDNGDNTFNRRIRMNKIVQEGGGLSYKAGETGFPHLRILKKNGYIIDKHIDLITTASNVDTSGNTTTNILN